MPSSAEVRALALKALRILMTLLVVAVAVLAGRWLWVRYELAPWTRDGRVRADVVAVAPDVAGFVTELRVIDNQAVRRGQVLFVLDQPRYRIALETAQATVMNDQATLAEAEREAARNRVLGPLVAVETAQQADTRVAQSRATLKQAQANVDAAALNLERTTVRASVDGVVTNVELRPGDYITAGRQALALVDTDSLHVDGYFEETKLPRIHVGDPVEVTLMGERSHLHGHVESIAAAIIDRERASSPDLVANVNPTFSWVRLAQRVPVRVRLDHVPADVRLIAGRTATVAVLDSHPGDAQRDWWRLGL